MEVVESRYFYEGMSHLLHKEYSKSGSPYAEFYIGPNQQITSQKMFGYHGRSIPGHDPSMKTTGGLMYHHYDGMASVSELTDRHGDVIQRYRHDAFGGLLNGITSPYNTNGYTGHHYDQDVGLIDMKARWYDAKIGRFLQEDTYAGTLDNPLSQNRYAYVMNNPVNYWDPTGRVPVEVLNRQDFSELRVKPSHKEWWDYSFQSYSSTTSIENYTQHMGLRELTIRWDSVLTEEWRYVAEYKQSLNTQYSVE